MNSMNNDKKFQIQYDKKLFSFSRRLKGRIYIKIDGFDFPNNRWLDYPLTILHQWLTQLKEFYSDTEEEREFWFWEESFYYFKIELINTKKILLVAMDTEGTEYRRTVIDMNVFQGTIMSACNDVLDMCKNKEWESCVRKELEVLLKTTALIKKQIKPKVKLKTPLADWFGLSKKEFWFICNNAIQKNNISSLKDYCNMTLLHFAIWQGWDDIVLCLLNNSFDINSEGIYWWDHSLKGLTALHLSAWRGNSKIVKCLIKSGSNINKQDSYGCTALHHAALSGDVPTVTSIFIKEPDFSITDKYGRIALNIAEEEGHDEIIKILKT